MVGVLPDVLEAGKPPKFITALHSFTATHCSGCACEFPARWHGSKKKDLRVLRGSQQIITTGGGFVLSWEKSF